MRKPPGKTYKMQQKCRNTRARLTFGTGLWATLSPGNTLKDGDGAQEDWGHVTKINPNPNKHPKLLGRLVR